MGDFQEKQRHLLLISQHNSMSNLLCTGTICMNTTKNFVPQYNDSICEITTYLVMNLNLRVTRWWVPAWTRHIEHVCVQVE